MATLNGDPNLQRTTSQISNISRKSSSAKPRSRKQSLVTPNSSKTLESFPSLSPDASPGAKADRQLVSSPQATVTKETPTKSRIQSPSIVEKLTKTTPSFRGRDALFEDSPRADANNVPGALHLASDEHIRRLIEKNGAIALVKQVSEDLASREAEMAGFRRRAEGRERELKKMLKEVEVSNLDIEKRLHRMDKNGATFGLGITASSPNPGSSASQGGKEPLGGVSNGIDEMMGEAMKDGVGKLDLNENYLDSLNGNDKQATVKARDMVLKQPGRRSTASSVDSQGQSNGTVRGWKEYFWNGPGTSKGTSKASSVSGDNYDGIETVSRTESNSNGRRKGLDDDLFSPPTGISSTQSSGLERRSRKSSASVTSWTMKFFAGNPQAGREPENPGTIQSKSVSDRQTKRSRTTSKVSEAVPPVPPIPSSAQAALMRVNGMDGTIRAPRKPVPPLALGSSSTIKHAGQSSSAQMPNSPASTVGNAINLGPVEMDTIHPPDSRPPTLVSTNYKAISNDLLTDRFGFIYNQHRRNKEAEAPPSHKRGKSNASTNKEMIRGLRDSLKPADNDQASQMSKSERPETPNSLQDHNGDRPTRRWTEYLKVATFPTELLSHTPSAKPGPQVINPDTLSPQLKLSPTTKDARSSLPSLNLSNPKPELSPVVAGNAEITASSSASSAVPLTVSAGEGESVRLLLAQLTELHDTLQREKTTKWNEFLRKVRAERKKDGESATNGEQRYKQLDTPEVKLTDGEIIGVAGLGNKGKVGRAKWKEFKQLVLGGIPVAYRSKIWAECSGASALRVPGYYEDLFNHGVDDLSTVSQIEMDINRTLTDNVFFRKGPGVSKLKEVLSAYARRNPEVGYCQGMNLITASLLLIMPTAEDAFWVLTSMIENILPQHYYDKSLITSRADQQVLREYVTEILPKLSVHLDDLGIELEALTFQWFLSIFTDCLSAEALFRVWDVILCFNDGSTFLFQVAVALLKVNEAQLLECDTAAVIYNYIGNEMTDHAISIDGLINASEALKNVIKRNEVEERRWRVVETEREREKEKSKGRSRGSLSEGTSTSSSAGDLSIQEPRPLEE